MTESPFLALAERLDLDYAEQVAPGAAGKFPFPHGEVSELVGGALPSGYEGLAARLRRHVGDSETATELTLVVTRIPGECRLRPFHQVLRGWVPRSRVPSDRRSRDQLILRSTRDQLVDRIDFRLSPLRWRDLPNLIARRPAVHRPRRASVGPDSPI